MDLKEIGIYTRNWVDSTQDRDYCRALVNASLNLRVAYAMELVSEVSTATWMEGDSCLHFVRVDVLL